jgi:hypothetical protein
VRHSRNSRPFPPPATGSSERGGRAPRAARRAGDPLGALLDVIDVASGVGCTALFGDGSIEFSADRLDAVDSDGRTDLGPVSYRAGTNNTVYVLPQQGLRLIALRLASPDQFSLVTPALECTMTRTTAAGARTSTRATAPAAPAPASTASAPRATGPLLTFEENATGYQCPIGQKPIVLGCEGSAATSPCKVVFAERPTPNGFQGSESEPRGVLAALVNRCKSQKIAADSLGNIVFVP